MNPPSRARMVRRTLRRVTWVGWAVGLLLITAILWVLLRPDMWGPCLVLTGAAIALAITGRDTE